MPKFRASCWLGSETGRQELEVQANTWGGAKQQLKQIYRINDNDIYNLREVSDNSSGRSNPTDSETQGISPRLIISGVVIIGFLYALSEYTKFVVMLVFGLAGFWIGKKFNNIPILIALTIGLAAFGYNLGVGWHESIKNTINELSAPLEQDSAPESQKYLTPSPQTNTPIPQNNAPSQFRIRELPKASSEQLSKEEKNCEIWRNTYPEIASKLQPDEKCYK